MFSSTASLDNNKLQLYISVANTILLSVLLVSAFCKNVSLFPKESKYLSEDSLISRICSNGLSSIANKEADSRYIVSTIYDTLINSNYEALPIEINEMARPEIIDESNCKVITSDSVGERSFLIELEKNGRFPFNYKISNIKELATRQKAVR